MHLPPIGQTESKTIQKPAEEFNPHTKSDAIQIPSNVSKGSPSDKMQRSPSSPQSITPELFECTLSRNEKPSDAQTIDILNCEFIITPPTLSRVPIQVLFDSLSLSDVGVVSPSTSLVEETSNFISSKSSNNNPQTRKALLTKSNPDSFKKPPLDKLQKTKSYGEFDKKNLPSTKFGGESAEHSRQRITHHLGSNKLQAASQKLDASHRHLNLNFLNQESHEADALQSNGIFEKPKKNEVDKTLPIRPINIGSPRSESGSRSSASPVRRKNRKDSHGRQLKNSARSKIMFLSNSYISTNNNFIKEQISEAAIAEPPECIKIKEVSHESNKKTKKLSNLISSNSHADPTSDNLEVFDMHVIDMMQKLLADAKAPAPPTPEFIKKEMFNFCDMAIKEYFVANHMSLDDYRDIENKWVFQLFETLQNNGFFLKNILNRLLLLRKYLCNTVSLIYSYTDFTYKLNQLLKRLIEIDTFVSKDKCYQGKNIHNFLNVFDEMLLTYKDTEMVHEKSHSKITQSLHITTSSPRKESALPQSVNPLFHPIKQILLNAIGGESVLQTLRPLAMPLNQWSAFFELFKKYCRKSIYIYDGIRRLSFARHQCFIEHIFHKDGSNLTDAFKNAQGVDLFHTSYATKPCIDVIRCLKPDDKAEVIPNKIIVNNEVVYEKSIQVKSVSQPNPTLYFWEDLIGAFYKHGFGTAKANKKVVNEIPKIYSTADFSLQAHNLKYYSSKSELLNVVNEDGQKPDIYKIVPSLKILEMMTINCLQVASLYMGYIYPKFFSERFGIDSQFCIDYPKDKAEIEVKISNSEKFKVAQRSKFNICLKGNRNVRIATLDYTWTNKPSIKRDEPGEKIHGWEGTLKITGYKILLPQYEREVLRILSDPLDASSHANLPGGLQYSTKYKRE